MVGRGHLKSPERKEQIAEAALNVATRYGVRGTTLTRIAAEVGLTGPALYTHFASRREILLAALDVLMRKRSTLQRSVQGNAIERLREVAHLHTQLVACVDDRSVYALFEFIAAAPEEGLRETLGARHLDLVRDIARIVEEGQLEGSVKPDVDPLHTAWMIVGRAWLEDITHLLGVERDWDEDDSNQMLDMIIESIAVPNNAQVGV